MMSLLVWFFSSVDSHVPCQLLVRSELFVTKGAWNILLLVVQFHVFLEVLRSSKYLFTNRAFKGLSLE